MSDELVVLENLNAVEVFVAGGTDKILQAIRDEVINDVPDITTAKGRSEIASRAHKVAKSKVAIDKLGKELADKLNAQLKPINAERKKSKDTLEALKIEVREPLQKWEDDEAQRVITLKERLTDFDFYLDSYDGFSIELVKKSLNEAKLIPINDTWQEFRAAAEIAKPVFIEKLSTHLNVMVKDAEAAAELERLQKAEADRVQKEREDKIAKDAAAAAEAGRIAAEAREKQGIEDAKARLKAAQNKAAEDQKAAEIKAEADKKAAIEAERKKVADIKEAEVKAAADREADTAHKKKINNSILKALSKESGISEEVAKKIIKAIHLNKIPNTKINY